MMFRTAVVLLAVVLAGCAVEPPVSLSLNQLRLAEIVLTDEERIEATLTIEGVLNDAPLELNEDRTEAAGEFTLPAVTEETTAPFVVNLRLVRGEEKVLLARLSGETTLRPGARNELAPEGSFDTCGAPEPPCAFAFDLNRNEVPNLDDLAGGVDPLPPAPFVALAPDTLQFASGVRLGQFARQAIVVSNTTARELELRAQVVGAAGVTLARFTTEPDPNASAQRALEGLVIGPFEEVLLAVSFAPVNGFLTTGAVSFEIFDPLTSVRQASQVALIANADGQLRPSPTNFVEPAPIADGADLGGYDGEVVPFPAAELFSGLPLEQLGGESGLPLTGRTLSATVGERALTLPADAAFLFEIPPEHKLSAQLAGLDLDVDLAFVLLEEGDNLAADGTRNKRPSAVGTSAEAVEHLNTTTSTQRALLFLGRLDPDDVRARAPFALTAQLTNAPEFLGPPSPLGGPVEGGALVTLTGRGFHPAATVLFADAVAPDCAHEEEAGVTTIVCSAPPGSLAVGKNPATVVVQNPGADEGGDGQAATLPAAFAYQPPAPQLFSINPAVSTTAGGGSVTLTGAFFTTEHATPIVRFGAEPALSVQFVDPTTLIAQVPPQGPGPVNVRVRNVVSAEGALSIESNLRSFSYVEPQGDPPSLSGVSPATGSIDGGAQVTLTGSGFQEGASVTFDSVLAESSISGPDAIIATAPPGAAGAVDVEITNPDGQRAILQDAFTYFIPAPTLSGVTPSRATITGGTFVAITGTGFRAGVQVRFDRGSNSFPSPNVSRINDRSLLVAAPTVTSGGDYTIRVTNFDGQEVIFEGFTFVEPSGPPPQIASISPNTGDLAFATPVVVTGQGFDNPTVVVGSTGVPDVTRGGEGQAQTLSFEVPPGAAPGPVVVRVTNEDGQGDTTVFNYFEVQGAAPVISSVTPGEGAAGTQVVIEGASFDAAGLSLVLGNQLIDQIDASSSTRVVATLPVVGLPAGASSASLTLELRNPDGQVARTSFRFLADPRPAPRLTSVSPDRGDTEGGTAVTLSGLNLDAAEGVLTLGEQVLADVTSTSSVSFTTPAHAAGLVLLRVTNGDGQFAEIPFRFEAVPAPAPAVAIVLPSTVSGVVDDARITLIGQDLDAVESVDVSDGQRAVTATVVSQSSGALELQLDEVLGAASWTADLLVDGASAAQASFASATPSVTVADLDSGGLLLIGAQLAGAALTGGSLRLASGGPDLALSVTAASDTLVLLEPAEPPVPGASYRFDLDYAATAVNDLATTARTARLQLSQGTVAADTDLSGTNRTGSLDEILPGALAGPLSFTVDDGGGPQSAGTWSVVSGGASLVFDAVTLSPGSYTVTLRSQDSSAVARGVLVAQ